MRFSDLVESNKVVEGAWIDAGGLTTGCVLCGRKPEGESAVRLNNGGRVCKPCFEGLQYVYFPETYQRRHVDYTVAMEDRRLARLEFEDTHPCTATIRHLRKAKRAVGWLMAGSVVSCAGLGLLTMAATPFFWILGVLLAALFLGTWATLRRSHRSNEVKLTAEMTRWDQANPAPPVPELRQFHDPQAVLTEHDQRVLEVFDYWPGYPPFWAYVRSVVLASDGQRCQVTGCPSRTELHIHHMLPVSEAGSHRPDNLVTLCEFHHGLCPAPGHERVWGQITTRYFTMVRAHLRNGHPVKTHVRRLELATQEQLERIIQFHAMACKGCGHPSPRITVDYEENTVDVHCPKCSRLAEWDQKLLEENGPWLTTRLSPKTNVGRWHDNSAMMESRRPPVGRRRSEGRLSRPARLKAGWYPRRRRW
ncbi:MAG: HNH endonuclease [candidate division WOR-3 bacterium]|nr:HNH endonuclease [candidate division WOR-3 bacterium]